MKNITVSVDDDTYRRARVKAAEENTSVSAVVKQFLADFATGETRFERLKRQEHELRKTIAEFGFRASDRLSRDEVHERKA